LNNIQLLIIAVTVITILATLLIFWHKGLLQKHKKKIASTLVTASILSTGITLLFTSSLIIEPSAGNTVYSVWFKSTNYNAYVTTNTSLPFEYITIQADYLYFNDTCFIVDSTNRTNITIMFMLTYDYIANENDHILIFYANCSEVENVTFLIGGLEAATDYNITRNGSAYLANTSNATGFISFYNNFTSDDYFVLLDVYKAVGVGSSVNYPVDIRKGGIDYFVWLGANVSASTVAALIPGFDESTEYIAIWTATGSWNRYYGDVSGTNWDIHTFNVIQSYMTDGAGVVSFSMTSNTNIDYDLSRSVDLTYKAYGYNYTGYTNSTTATTMSAANTSYLQLPRGYWLALWNETTYTWNYWISEFPGSKNQPLDKYNVVMTRIEGDKTWTI